MMKYIKVILLICVLPLFFGCDNSKAVVGYINPPDSMSPPNGLSLEMTSEKLEGVFYTALQGLPIEKIDIPTRGSKNYPVNITVKEGYEMDDKMKQKILIRLTDYKESLIFITDEDGTLVSAQHVMENNQNITKDEDEPGPFYFLSSWRNVYMKVYKADAPNYYDRTRTFISCVLLVYPKMIDPSEINQYSQVESNIPVFESFDGLPFIVDFDEKYNTVLYRDLGVSPTLWGSFGRLDINGGLHSECWQKLKNESAMLYDAIYVANILEYFKQDK